MELFQSGALLEKDDHKEEGLSSSLLELHNDQSLTVPAAMVPAAVWMRNDPVGSGVLTWSRLAVLCGWL